MERTIYRGDIGPQPSSLKWLPHMICRLGMLFWMRGVELRREHAQPSPFTNVFKGEVPNVNFMVKGYEYN